MGSQKHRLMKMTGSNTEMTLPAVLIKVQFPLVQPYTACANDRALDNSQSIILVKFLEVSNRIKTHQKQAKPAAIV